MKTALHYVLVWLALIIGIPMANAGSVLPLPSVSGPSLGDPTSNIYSIIQQLQLNTTSNFTSFTTLTVAAGPLTATQLQYGFNFLTAASGTTVSVVLPQAKPGAQILIANGTSQGIQVFAAVPTSTLPGSGAGSFDYINGSIGTTAYVNTSLTAKTVDCIVPVLGSWWCSSGI